MRTRSVAVRFRFPVQQIADKAVEVVIPVGDGPHPVNAEFIRAFKLSDREIEACENAVLREIVIDNS